VFQGFFFWTIFRFTNPEHCLIRQILPAPPPPITLNYRQSTTLYILLLKTVTVSVWPNRVEARTGCSLRGIIFYASWADESWIGKRLQRSGGDHIHVVSHHFAWRDCRKTSNNLKDYPMTQSRFVQRTRPNTNLKHYRCIGQLGHTRVRILLGWKYIPHYFQYKTRIFTYFFKFSLWNSHSKTGRVFYSK
jgi:hypothetical protein